MVSLFNLIHSYSYVLVSPTVLICIFLMTNDAEYLFMYLLVIHISSLVKQLDSNILPTF